MSLDLIPHGENSGEIGSFGNIVIESDVNATGEGDIVFKTSGVERARISSVGITSGVIGSQTLVWSDSQSDYLPVIMKAISSPKEFRGPVDPQIVAGVVLNKRDSWDATV